MEANKPDNSPKVGDAGDSRSWFALYRFSFAARVNGRAAALHDGNQGIWISTPEIYGWGAGIILFGIFFRNSSKVDS